MSLLERQADDVEVPIWRAPTPMLWQAPGRPRGLVASLPAGAKLVPKAACAGSAAPRMAAGRSVLAFGPAASGLPVCWLLATARRGRAVRHGVAAVAEAADVCPRAGAVCAPSVQNALCNDALLFRRQAAFTRQRVHCLRDRQRLDQGRAAALEARPMLTAKSSKAIGQR